MVDFDIATFHIRERPAVLQTDSPETGGGRKKTPEIAADFLVDVKRFIHCIVAYARKPLYEAVAR
jgi:hypothetical protein